MITYKQGDASLPPVDPDRLSKVIIPHVVNNAGQWGAGFVMALSAHDRAPEIHYRKWYMGLYEKPFRLGEIQIVPYSNGMQVCNMLAQDNVKEPDLITGRRLRYWALSRCLVSLRQYCQQGDFDIHAPKFGCGIAGGTWDCVSTLIEFYLRGVPVTIYTL